jgi:hypothetical protein
MRTRILRWLGPTFGVAALSLGVAFGCSSSTSAPNAPSSDCEAGACADAAVDHPGDGNGTHDGPPPDALYACALPGSFGAPCTASASGPDPTACTDPTYPQCFVGGQGAWCTKLCTDASDCTATSDAGCAPTSCNARGYCK